MKNQSGNALLFVLLGIVLFGALSYALSQAGNSRDSIDTEKAEIAATELIDYAMAVRNTYRRLKTVGRYEQVQLSFNGENTAGTCYSGGTSYTCRSIGLFSPEANLFAPDIEPYMVSPPNDHEISWISTRTLVNGTDVGTSQPDIIMTFRYLDPEICKAINFNLHQDETIPGYTTGTDSGGLAGNFLETDGSVTTYTTYASYSFEFPLEDGCMLESGLYNQFTFVLEKN